MEREEFKWLVITTIVLGFCFSFRDWGIEKFNFRYGIQNLIIVSLLVGFSILVHEIVHKLVAKKYDAELKFKTWWSLLLTALLVTILTNGYIVFAAVWVVAISTKHLLRPRHKFPHLGPWESAKIAASGPISNFFMALIFAYFAIKTGAWIWNKLMVINFWIASMNLFPFFRAILIPVLGSKALRYYAPKAGVAMRQFVRSAYMEGEIVFFGSRVFGMFLLTLTTITAIVILYSKLILLGILSGIFVSAIVYIFMQYYVEHWDYLVTQPAQKLPKFKRK